MKQQSPGSSPTMLPYATSSHTVSLRSSSFAKGLPRVDFFPSDLPSSQSWERRSLSLPASVPQTLPLQPCALGRGNLSVCPHESSSKPRRGTSPAGGTHNSGQNMPFPVKMRSCGKQQLTKRSIFCTKREWRKQIVCLGEGTVFAVKSS